MAPRAPLGTQLSIALASDGAVPLEPAVNIVSVQDGPSSASVRDGVSARARYVHSTARVLVEEHELLWDQALSVANSCWQTIAGRADIIQASRETDEDDAAALQTEVIDVDDGSADVRH